MTILEAQTLNLVEVKLITLTLGPQSDEIGHENDPLQECLNAQIQLVMPGCSALFLQTAVSKVAAKYQAYILDFRKAEGTENHKINLDDLKVESIAELGC